jgi:hypothetical protein
MGHLNKAAWIREPKGQLIVDDAPYPVPAENEMVIKVWQPSLLLNHYPIKRSWLSRVILDQSIRHPTL